MNFNFLKQKKDKLPEVRSLRPDLFRINMYWFASLLISAVILLITAFIGFKLFYSQYNEDYKKSVSAENFGNIINVNRLSAAVEKRNELSNEQISLPRDPSL
jgi:hypothetical protein